MLPADEPPFWDAERDDTLVCRQVRAETHDVKTFIFAASAPRLFRYKPGQFMTFEFAIDGERIDRCFTLASTPTRPHLVSITVKRQPDGVVTPWLHATMRPGTAVRVAGPMGDFSCADHPAESYLFLSGGSGITPLMSMARSHDDLASERDTVFVHNARSPADIIFRSELALMAEHRPGFRFVPVCEADSPGEKWAGLRGRLSLPMLQLIAPDFLERAIFCCGPAPYMAAVRAMLAEAGFDMARYFEESFDFSRLGGAAPAAASTAAEGFTVEFARSKRRVTCDAETFILTAAQAAGLRLPSSCTRGLCGTCKSKLLAGTVDMQHAGGIRQREIDQGLILICCSRPRSDLVIDR
ncbi:MAG: hybrid-cluster NAD(P)-dependent oxidoreductase [Acidisphaera sp.]|nr:hybrid-cluster NAD(P)-dependent oxidoreductase [Acidisphaera sp.]